MTPDLMSILGKRVTCPGCLASLRMAVIDPEPRDEIIVKTACPACGADVPLPT